MRTSSLYSTTATYISNRAKSLPWLGGLGNVVEALVWHYGYRFPECRFSKPIGWLRDASCMWIGEFLSVLIVVPMGVLTGHGWGRRHGWWLMTSWRITPRWVDDTEMVDVQWKWVESVVLIGGKTWNGLLLSSGLTRLSRATLSPRSSPSWGRRK